MRRKQIPRSFHEDEELTAYSLCNVSIMQRGSTKRSNLHAEGKTTRATHAGANMVLRVREGGMCMAQRRLILEVC
jgi:hypothetical protein